MTPWCFDRAKLADFVAHMKYTPPPDRLGMLKRAVIEHGGRWDMPSDEPGLYQPIMVSAQVFGICAFASDVDELPRNWLRAAENALSMEDEEYEHHA